MTNRYFTPADFSDFEDLQVVQALEPHKNPVPTAKEIENIKARLINEFQNCENGISKLCGHAVQASTTAGTKNLFSMMFDKFESSTILPFLEMTKQDYGLLVAEWAALQVLGPFCEEAITLAGKWRNNE